MPMTSHEIVRRTLDYEYPERVARSFEESDIVHVSCSVRGYATEWKEIRGGRWERTDEWGNLWTRNNILVPGRHSANPSITK